MNLEDLNSLDVRIFSGVNLFWGDITILVVMLLYILKAIRTDPNHWRDNIAVRGAVGWFVYCMGMALVRGWNVPLLVLIKHNYPTIPLENAYPISLIGTMIAMVGMYCMVRVYSPVKWLFWGWLIPLVVGVTTSILIILI